LLHDPDLHDRMLDEYARSYGCDPRGNWILIIHEDDTPEFYNFDSPQAMWCCTFNTEIRGALRDERARHAGVNTQ
jgi:hypothetical protein